MKTMYRLKQYDNIFHKSPGHTSHPATPHQKHINYFTTYIPLPTQCQMILDSLEGLSWLFKQFRKVKLPLYEKQHYHTTFLEALYRIS